VKKKSRRPCSSFCSPPPNPNRKPRRTKHAWFCEGRVTVTVTTTIPTTVAIMSTEKTAMDDVQRTTTSTSGTPHTGETAPEPKKPWWTPVITAGSAVQIVIAAALAIGIGMAVNTTVDDIPAAATTIIAIPGNLWLRSLKAVVLPLIVTAMILAVQRLRTMTGGMCSRSLSLPSHPADILDTRRQDPGPLDCRLLRCDNAPSHCHQHHPDGPRLGRTDAGGQRREPGGVGEGRKAH
jgi:hypothetical protein